MTEKEYDNMGFPQEFQDQAAVLAMVGIKGDPLVFKKESMGLLVPYDDDREMPPILYSHPVPGDFDGKEFGKIYHDEAPKFFIPTHQPKLDQYGNRTEDNFS